MNKRLSIVVVTLFLSACGLDDGAMVDTAPNPPVLGVVTVSPDFFNTAGFPGTTVDTVILIRAALLAPALYSTTVSYALYGPEENLLGSGTLHDDGIAPDQTADDGTFSANAALTIAKQDIGKYSVAVSSVNGLNEQSSASIHRIVVINTANLPPIVSALIAPDTVFVPIDNTVQWNTISVFAADSQGLEDIVAVSLFSVNPFKGTRSATIFMYDDGNGIVRENPFNASSGDEVQSDGRYTILIPIDKTFEHNTYRDFHFWAIDRSGASSDTLVKRIYMQ